jgi:hypothetical protein
MKNFQICRSLSPQTSLGPQIANSPIAKSIGSANHKLQIRKLPHLRKVPNCKKNFKSTNLLRFVELIGGPPTSVDLPLESTTPAVPVGKFTAGVVDTGGKWATGVVDTSSKFPTLVVDTDIVP